MRAAKLFLERPLAPGLHRTGLGAKSRAAAQAASATHPWQCQSTRASVSYCGPREQTGAPLPPLRPYLPGDEDCDPAPPDRSQIVCGVVPRLAAADTLRRLYF